MDLGSTNNNLSQTSPTDGTFAPIVARESGLRRSLSARKLSMIAIGGAIGTGLFLGSGFAIGIAGPAVLVSYAIGAVIALLLMGCLAEMTVVHPTPGSFGAYAEYYIGPMAGFVVRYAYWTCIVLAVGTEVTAVAIYMHFWFPTVPGWIWIVVFSAAMIIVNAISVETFGNVEYWLSLIKVSAIVAFIVLASYLIATASGADAIGLRNFTADGGFWPHGVGGMWVAVIMAVFSYLSIEMIAVAAGEAAQPQIAVTRAFRSTVVRLILFYILTLALMLAVLPWQQAGAAKSPFVMVIERLHLPAAGGIMNFVILVAALSAMNSQLYITSRMMFSLARGGQAPRQMGQLSARGVPLNALLLSTSGMALAAVISVAIPGNAFLVMVAISSFGAMFTWMMIFVTHWFFRRARARQGAAPSSFRMWGFPLTTWLGAGLMAALLLTTAFTSEFRMTLIFGVPYLAALIAIYLLRPNQRRTER